VQALVDGAVEATALTLRGSNYYLGERRIAIGKEKLNEVLTADSDLFQSVYNETYKLMKAPNTESAIEISTKDTEESDFDKEE
jgi:hypothetical protein